MKSNNPVFARSEEFNRASSNPYGNQTYAGGGEAYPGYGETPGRVEGSGGRMTVDSVIQKTAISVGLVFVTAIITWWYIGDFTGTDAEANAAASRALALAGLGAGGAFLLSLVNSFKRVISPALVLAFAAAEGVALGAVSKVFEAQFDGVVTSAVIGTFGAFAGTLAAYKVLDIKVGNKFRRGVVAGMFGMVGLGLLSLVLSFFGINTGLYGMGGLGFVFALAGLVLGVLMLILDFDFVENGVAAGLPDRESWRAAFGLTVSLVWIYTNLLRILAILRGD
jgi:uncharacterized YccA/Bax inhibitor family protein